jgi:phospholipid transport system substrate-binding protein
MHRVVAFFRLFVLGVLLAGPAFADDAAPKAPVEALNQKLLDVMRRSNELGFDGRARELRPVVESSFDMPFMAGASLGPDWTKLTPEQKDRLTQAFTAYSVAQYASSFSGYSGEQFQIGDVVKRPNGDVVVKSKIVPRSGTPTELDYLERQQGGQWKIIDVYLDGSVSQLAIRRSELSAVYKRGGVDGLTAALEQKAQQIAKP